MLQRLFHKIFLTIFGIFIFFSGSANAAETAQSFTFTSVHNPQIKAVFPVNPNKIEKQIHLPSDEQSPRGIKAVLLTPQYGPITTRQQSQELIVDTLKEKFIYTQEHDEKAVLLKEWIEAPEPNTKEGSTYIWKITSLNSKEQVNLKKVGDIVEIYLSSSNAIKPSSPNALVGDLPISQINPIIYFDKNNQQHHGNMTINPKDNTVTIYIKASIDQYPLRIDPTLRYGQWLGGQGGQVQFLALVYNTGNSTVILGGHMGSSGYIDESINISGTYNGGSDGFVVSILDGGTPSLIWGQYLGGNSNDQVLALAVNGSSIYATGYSVNSTQFTTLTFQGTHNGLTDGFVIKLTDGGTPTINWGQWIGGTMTVRQDKVNSIAINGSNIYIGGSVAGSTNFTTLTFQGTYNGNQDSFVIKMTDGGTPTINWGQWLGGTNDETITTISINGSSIYVGGGSFTSTNWTTLTFRGTHNGSSESFVIKLTDGGTPTINWGQWLGGSSTDNLTALALNGSNIFVGGYSSSSTNFTTLTFQGTHVGAGGAQDGFVIKLTDGGTPTINWGQWIGGDSTDQIYTLVVNGATILVGGLTLGSTSFTTLTFQGTANGIQDGFVISLTDGGTPTINWGQWISSTRNDPVFALGINASNIYVGGYASASTLMTPTTYHGTNNGGFEGLLIKMTDGGTPTLNWGQWLGGGGSETAAINGIAVSGQGVFLAGNAFQPFRFETLTFQDVSNGGTLDGFVIKFTNSTAPTLNWGYWIGGSSAESLNTLSVNGTNIFVAGSSSGSTNFTTLNFQGTFNGSQDGLLIKLTDGGTPTINWGQWIGGNSSPEAILGVTVNGSDIYIGGQFAGTTGFTTLTFQGTFNGTQDGMLIKMTDGGTPTINWGQWIGGTGSDSVYSIALNGTSIFIGGDSFSSTQYTTLTFQGQNNGSRDGMVIKLTDGGTPTINWGQWIGGNNQDFVRKVLVNGSSIYVGGYAGTSTKFTTLTFQGQENGSNEIMVLKMTDGGTPTINWGQWIGGNGADTLTSLAMNGSSIYVGGHAEASTNFTTLTFQGASNANYEGFVIKLTDGGTPSIKWGQWLGGEGTDTVNAIAVNGALIYAGGSSTTSTSWQTVTFQGDMLSASEAFVISINDPCTSNCNSLFHYDSSF